MSDETGCVNGMNLLPYPSSPDRYQPNELQTLHLCLQLNLYFSCTATHCEGPTRFKCRSGVTAGIGQMSLLGNVLSARGLSFINVWLITTFMYLMRVSAA